MDEINLISADKAARLYHVSVGELKKLADAGGITFLNKGDKNGYTLYVNQVEISGRFPRRSTAEKVKENIPAASVGAAIGGIFGQIMDVGKLVQETISDDALEGVEFSEKSADRSSSPSSNLYYLDGFGEFVQINNIQMNEYISRAGSTAIDFKRARKGEVISFQAANRLYETAKMIQREEAIYIGMLKMTPAND